MTDPDPTFVDLARTGDLEELMELVYASAAQDDGDDADADDDDEEGVGEEDGDALAYKWLCIAIDFGRPEAEDMLETLLETSDLRYDDDQFITGSVHLELGMAYLLGGDGLAKDMDKARAHLQEADDRGYPASLEDGTELLIELRTPLTGPARAVFDEIYPPTTLPS